MTLPASASKLQVHSTPQLPAHRIIKGDHSCEQLKHLQPPPRAARATIGAGMAEAARRRPATTPTTMPPTSVSVAASSSTVGGGGGERTLAQLAAVEPRWRRLLGDPSGLFNGADVVDDTYGEYLADVLAHMEAHACDFKEAVERTAAIEVCGGPTAGGCRAED